MKRKTILSGKWNVIIVVYPIKYLIGKNTLKLIFIEKTNIIAFQKKILYISTGYRVNHKYETVLILCEIITRKKFSKTSKIQSRLFSTGESVIFQICKRIYDPLRKQAHLQSHEHFRKKHYDKCDYNLKDINNLNNANGQNSIQNKQPR